MNLSKLFRENPHARLSLGAAGGFLFVLSALKLPSVTGSSSHPTGVGFGAALFGPSIMTVLGSVVLLFQALFLAHGGITTLGANVFSLAVVGAMVAWTVHRSAIAIGCSASVALFCAAMLSDLSTYATTAFQLALAFPDPVGGMVASFAKFLGIFAVTQIPLAVGEGLLTVFVANLVGSRAAPMTENVFPEAGR